MAHANTLRFAVAGALAAAIGAAVVAALGATSTVTATGECLAWFGAREDGICMGYSNGNPTYIGTPSVGVWGPGYGNNIPGMSTGPLLPGQTITQGISP